MKKKILYVEDEPALGRIVKETLESRNYEVAWESDGNKVMQQLSANNPDICILDIMLPNTDGYTLCNDISSRYPNIPIIFLTARADTQDLVKGFASGGRDYIKKPFSLEELIVRIENQLRINGANNLSVTLPDEVIMLGLYRFIPSRYELHSPNSVIKLSQRDMQVLSNLVSSRNRVIDRRELLLNVWGDDSFFNSRNLDVYIRKIREYFSLDSTISIQTLKGKGYLFLVP